VSTAIAPNPAAESRQRATPTRSLRLVGTGRRREGGDIAHDGKPLCPTALAFVVFVISRYLL